MKFKVLRQFWSVVLTVVLFLCCIPANASAAPSHIHSFADGWSFDTKGHWHACTGADCEETDFSAHTGDGFAYAAHDFDDDMTCTVCGAKEECEALPYSVLNSRAATEEELKEYSNLFMYYHYEGTDFVVDGTPMFDDTGATAGGAYYYMYITPKDSSVLISRIEAKVSDYGEDYYKAGISSGVKQENDVDGVTNGTKVHINDINANSFYFGGGYGNVEFNDITVYYVRTVPPCEHSFTGEYKNNGINHTRKCVNCGEYGPAASHDFVEHECACGAVEVVENSESLLYEDGSYQSGTYECDGTYFNLKTDHNDFAYGITVGGGVTLTISSKDPSLKITRIEAEFYSGNYIFIVPSSGEKEEKGNVANGTTVHINNINASTFTLTGSSEWASTMTDFTVYYTDGSIAHDFTGDYQDNENGKHQRKCTKCDEYNDEEEHVYEDGFCVCGAEDPAEFVINSEGVLIKYNGTGGAVVLPEGIVAIGDGVFAGKTTVTSVEIPYYGTYEDENIIGIGASAFEGCTNLTSILPEIPYTVKTIGENAFYGCEKLTTVTIADVITHNARRPVLGFLGDNAFDGDYLKTIKYYCYLDPDEVEEMMGRYEGTNAFSYEQLPHQYEDHECVLCGAIEHIHSFSYQAADNILTATCVSTAGVCELTGSFTLTLTAEGGTYDGNDFPACFETGEEDAWEAAIGAVPTIHYYLDGKEINDLPKTAGEYTAKITVGSETAVITYTILKEVPSYTEPTGLTAEYGQTLGDVILPTGFSWQDDDTTKVGNAGDNTFKVTYTPADTVNYSAVKDIEVTIDVTAKKLTKPSAATTEFVFDEEEQSLIVSGYDNSTMAEDGTLKATNVDDYSVTYSLKDKDNYTWSDDSTDDVTISWSITQASAPSITFPTADSVTYNPSLTLAKISLNGGSTAYGTFAWKNPSEVPTVDVTEYTVVFTPGALAVQNYGLKTSEKVISLSVSKATPEYTVPTGLTAEYGQTLGDVILPTGFSWQDDDTTKVGNAGDNTFKVTYTPADTVNYSAVKDIEVTIDVTAKKLTKPSAATTEFVFDEEEQSLIVSGYDNSTMAEDGTLKATNADDYSVTYSLKDKDNYTWSDDSTDDVTINWSITQASAPSITFPTADSVTYDPSLMLAKVTLNGGSTAYGTFAWKNPSEVPTVDVTKYTVVFTPNDFYVQNYGMTSTGDDIILNVSKATPEYTVPTGLTAEYGQTLEDVTLPTGFSWQEDDTTKVGNAGDNTFKVTYTPADTVNYSAVKDIEVTIDVTAKKLTKPSAATTEFVFDEEEQSLIVSGYDNSTMAEDGTLKATNVDDYSVTYSLKDKDNYTWSDDSTDDVTISWSITQAAAPSITFPTADSVAYNPSLTLAKISLNGGSTAYGTFAWKNPSEVPTVDVTEYTVVFTPGALAVQNYGLKTSEKVISLNVSKATPEYTVPTGLTAEYGQTLEDVTLPTGFSWQDEGTTSVGETGEHIFKIAFTPADASNYAEVRDIPVTVTVSKMTITVSFVMNGHGTQIAPQALRGGEKAIKPEEPSETGWVFGGWYADSELKLEFDYNNNLSGNTVIYAKWTQDVKPPVNYIMLSGTDNEWSKDETTRMLYFRSSAEYEKFVEVLVDGEVVDTSFYTSESGSTIVRLKPAYLIKLALGRHKMVIRSNDGEASCYFLIKSPPSPTPGTGDNSNTILWIILLGVSVILLFMTAFCRHRKKRMN